MSAAEILKMIETVSPDDTAMLDEIDARVWCWAIPIKDGFPSGSYTRSRDALKAIRPECFRFECYSLIRHEDFGGGVLFAVNDGYALPTEELAELHSIIKLIEYEREKS